MCRFGSPISLDPTGGNEDNDDDLRNSFLRGIPGTPQVNSWSALSEYFQGITPTSDDEQLVFDLINNTLYSNNPFNLPAAHLAKFDYTKNAQDDDAVVSTQPWDRYFTVRTCNSFWNPQVPIRVTNVDPFYLGMSSQATEREDTIITPDLRGKVYIHIHYIEHTVNNGSLL